MGKSVLKNLLFHLDYIVYWNWEYSLNEMQIVSTYVSYFVHEFVINITGKIH